MIVGMDPLTGLAKDSIVRVDLGCGNVSGKLGLMVRIPSKWFGIRTDVSIFTYGKC
jgi:hypothetical protein